MEQEQKRRGRPKKIENMKEHMRLYRINMGKTNCECGRVVNTANIKKHTNTIFHKYYILTKK